MLRVMLTVSAFVMFVDDRSPGSVGAAGDVLLPAPRAWKRNTCDL